MGHEHEAAPSASETAVLDIGGDVGAVMLITGPEYLEREVEISPVEKPEARVHTAIHERRLHERVVFAGLFPSLRAGAYRIWTDRPDLQDRVTVVGGEVAEVVWTTGAGEPTHSVEGHGAGPSQPEVSERD